MEIEKREARVDSKILLALVTFFANERKFLCELGLEVFHGKTRSNNGQKYF
jgi:hypothetical protein